MRARFFFGWMLGMSEVRKDRVWKICAGVFAVLLLTEIALFFVGVEERSLERLLSEKVVSTVTHCRFLHATGYLRENLYFFECDSRDLLRVDQGGVEFSVLDESDLEARPGFGRMQALLNEHSGRAIDWESAEVSEGERQNLLCLVYKIVTGDTTFIVLDVF